MRSIVSVSKSTEVGSTQCASSKIIRRGPRCGQRSSCRAGHEDVAALALRVSGRSGPERAEAKQVGRKSRGRRDTCRARPSRVRSWRASPPENPRASGPHVRKLRHHRLERTAPDEAAGRSSAGRSAARSQSGPSAPTSGAICRSPAPRTTTQRGLRRIRLLPSTQQELQFLLPADQRRLAGSVQGLEPALHRALAQHAPGADRSVEALELRRLDRSYSNASPVRRRVVTAITTVFGAAADCRRAARFGVSPTTLRSCASPAPTSSPTTTRPVAMPMRT